MLRSRTLICAASAVLLAACETTPVGPASEFVPDKVVSADFAHFWKLGPAQASGPDLSLRTNEKVMMLQSGFGFSRVQLENGMVGYMANEDIQPAPEPPPEQKRKKSKKKSSRGSESYDDYEENIPIPDPNLGILPDDVPLEPLPDLLPEGVDLASPTPAPTPQPTPVKEEAIPEGQESETAAPVSTST
jgi:hypothetical protein